MKSDYLIANNGTQIFDCAGELLFRLSIPHEIGFKLLRQFYTSDGYYLFFYDLDRKLECGIFNGTTLLRDERSLHIILNDFIEEARLSETYDRIELCPAQNSGTYANLVGMAKNIRDVARCSVTVSLTHSRALSVTPEKWTTKDGLKILSGLLQAGDAPYDGRRLILGLYCSRRYYDVRCHF